jgi:3-dehydroquinate synthase
VKTVRVDLGKRSYDILIGAGLLDQFHQVLERYKTGKRLFLISNPSVSRLFGTNLFQRLSGNGYQVAQVFIPDGEAHKSLKTVEAIYASQVDSSVGGKTGVNHRLGKNMIGAFYQPQLVCIDTDTLSSLPPREFQSGLYEVVKYGLICDSEFFEFLEGHLEEIQKRTPNVLKKVISRCCEIKAEITSSDEKEAGLRRILNFGHTFGHALEAATEFQGLTHGEAIAWGMLAETRLSFMKGDLDESNSQRISRCIRRMGELPPVDLVPTQGILEAMKRDKKRQDDQIVFVLLEDIGKTRITEGIEEDVLIQAWEEIART